MIKISEMPLAELYARPSITLSVENAIRNKEDFSSIQDNYCTKVCKLNCKDPKSVQLEHDPVDVLIIQDHDALPERFKDGIKIEKSHRTIISELCKTNLKNMSYRLVNLLKCRVTQADMVKGKAPSVIKLQKCSPYLLEEIKRSKPSVIISLTTAVTKSLGLGKYSNTNNRGEVQFVNGIPVVLTLHPKVSLMIRQNSSGAMWGPDYWDVINRDFAKAGKLVRKELAIPALETALESNKNKITVARSLAEAVRLVERIKALPLNIILSFDTETTGLDPWHGDAKLLSIQFGFKSGDHIETIVFPLWHRSNTFYDPNVIWEMISEILEGPQPKIGHNVKFDILYIWATKRIRVQNIIFDTMLVLHNINSGIQGNYGLKRAVWDWCPDLGLGGYEDKLPKLTKSKVEAEEDGEIAEV